MRRHRLAMRDAAPGDLLGDPGHRLLAKRLTQFCHRALAGRSGVGKEIPGRGFQHRLQHASRIMRPRLPRGGWGQPGHLPR
ncbi:MAG: hypothetical protein B7Z10_13275 [Rhodobacterales bacterium 32-66-7]|nr:MAG: hypothetical protein B7Z10_13275 [Rhodobacterales bacterium 32-66-7]